MHFILTKILETQWNLSIMDLRIKDTSVIRTFIDGPKRSAIETIKYLLDLRIKDTSLFRITDAWSGPKWPWCIVNELYS